MARNPQLRIQTLGQLEERLRALGDDIAIEVANRRFRLVKHRGTLNYGNTRLYAEARTIALALDRGERALRREAREEKRLPA